jgi:hypothetical protein
MLTRHSIKDIARLAAIGVNAYSFSIAWTRLFPFGSGSVNELGIAHYNDVIDTCIQYNITPMATLHHWDMPALLQNKYGGWLGEEVVGDFREYARVAYGRFGDRVKHWFTINEPIVICTQQYPMPDGYWRNLSIPKIEQQFVCGRNILLAHAEAYRLGKSIIPDSSITFKHNGGYKIALTNSSADAEAVQRAWDFNEGVSRWLWPLAKSPADMRNSGSQIRSILPEIGHLPSTTMSRPSYLLSRLNKRISSVDPQTSSLTTRTLPNSTWLQTRVSTLASPIPAILYIHHVPTVLTPTDQPKATGSSVPPPTPTPHGSTAQQTGSQPSCPTSTLPGQPPQSKSPNSVSQNPSKAPRPYFKISSGTQFERHISMIIWKLF